MSERDSLEPCRRFSYAPIWLVSWIFFILLGPIVFLGLDALSQLRDLQRRIAVLEQSPSLTQLPTTSEAHWCFYCAPGSPCGRGSGAWYRKLDSGQYACFVAEGGKDKK